MARKVRNSIWAVVAVLLVALAISWAPAEDALASVSGCFSSTTSAEASWCRPSFIAGGPSASTEHTAAWLGDTGEPFCTAQTTCDGGGLLTCSRYDLGKCNAYYSSTEAWVTCGSGKIYCN